MLPLHHGAKPFQILNIKYREKYDIAISRAVAPLNILLEYLSPFVKVGGNVIAMKGSSSEEEIKEAKNALNVLQCKVEKNYKFELPDNLGQRNNIIINKLKNTPKAYPRKAGTPKKNPL